MQESHLPTLLLRRLLHIRLSHTLPYRRLPYRRHYRLALTLPHRRLTPTLPCRSHTPILPLRGALAHSAFSRRPFERLSPSHIGGSREPSHAGGILAHSHTRGCVLVLRFVFALHCPSASCCLEGYVDTRGVQERSRSERPKHPHSQADDFSKP